MAEQTFRYNFPTSVSNGDVQQTTSDPNSPEIRTDVGAFVAGLNTVPGDDAIDARDQGPTFPGNYPGRVFATVYNFDID